MGAPIIQHAMRQEMRLSQPRIKYQGSRTKHQTVMDGIRVASPGEAERYLELQIEKITGKIRDFSLQPVFEIQPAFDKVNHVTGEKIHYRKREYLGDFKVIELDGRIRIEDTKGARGFTTEIYKLKKVLVEFRYPHITIQEVRQSGREKRIDELMKKLTALRENTGV